MRNHDIDKLTEQLRTVQIGRQQALRRVQEADTQEGLLLQRLREAQEAESRRAARLATSRSHRLGRTNNRHALENKFVIGEPLEITNNLRGERGTRGVVVSAGRRFVEILTDSGVLHKRAYWNLAYYLQEDIEDGSE